MQDLCLEAILYGCSYPATPDEFADLVWNLAKQKRGLIPAREVYNHKTGSTYHWFKNRDEVHSVVNQALPVQLSDRKTLLLYSPSGLPAGDSVNLRTLRERYRGRFTWLEWEPNTDVDRVALRIGGILFSTPSRDEVEQEIRPYVPILHDLVLQLIPVCKPVLALCGEMREQGPAIRSTSRAVQRQTIWAIEWMNVFGPPYVEKYGKDFLIRTPGYKKLELPGGYILYQVTEDFFPEEGMEPTPKQVEEYFSSHPEIGKVSYRPWLKKALISGRTSSKEKKVTEQTKTSSGQQKSLLATNRPGFFSLVVGRKHLKEKTGTTPMHSTFEGLLELADGTANDAKRRFDANLDFSPASVPLLDDIIDKVFDPNERMFTATIVSFGSYLGEVVIRNLGGRWRPASDWRDCAVVDIGNVAEVYPMRRVIKRVEEGRESSLESWYAAIEQHYKDKR